MKIGSRQKPKKKKNQPPLEWNEMKTEYPNL